MTRKPQRVDFFTNAEYVHKPHHMDFYCASTKNRSFTIWFGGKGVEYNLNDPEGGYSYASKYPLPTHHAIINNYGIKEQIKKWNESHDQS